MRGTLLGVKASEKHRSLKHEAKRVSPNQGPRETVTTTEQIFINLKLSLVDGVADESPGLGNAAFGTDLGL
jgi:hypothetical protein